MKDGLVASEVSVWSPHRKVISKAFTYKSLPVYLDCMNKAAAEIFEIANKSLSNGFTNILPEAAMDLIIESQIFNISTGNV